MLRELQLQPGRFVLCVARLVPEKGLDYLIEAFRRSGDERTLVIAGAGKKGDAFADRLLKEAAPDVRMLGMQTRSTLGVLYRNASLFVLPSFHEGLPIAALEALSCNCPVLLSDIQPNLDLDLPEQCYFPVGDVEELAARLGDHDPTREHAEADIPAILMGWDEVATLTASCYREMVPLQACATRLRNAG
ncbi:glycosyltransferase [Novosphingobium panipatense]